MRSNSRVITAIFLGVILSLVPTAAFCAEGPLSHFLDGKIFEAISKDDCSIAPRGQPPSGPCTVVFSEAGEWEFMHGDVGEGGKFTVDRSGDITAVSRTEDKFIGHFDADKNELMWGRSGELIKFIERKNPKE
jgi:hypothetical protein